MFGRNTRGHGSGRLAQHFSVVLATPVAIAVLVLASPGIASAEEATPWFKESINIEAKVVAGAACSEVAEKGKGEKNVGGQASAIFDDNNDGIPDITLVNGSNNFYVDQGKRNAKGEVEYAKEATRYPLNQSGELNSNGEQVSSRAKSLGLDDFTRSGKLGLFVGNAGTGTLSLVRPRNLSEAYAPSNLNKKNLCQTNKRRIWTSNGNGTFTNNSSLGEESEGVTRTPLFADFSGDGHQDQLDLNAPYYGIWWGNSPAPSSLHPGEANGTFGKNILNEAVVNESGEPEPELFQEKYGRGNIDIKGAIVRDLTNNGKPDVVASAYADQWDGVNEEPFGIAHKEGGEIDLNHPGENIPDGGWQGGWKHGLLALRNVSTPGHIKFVNESATAFPEEGLGYGNRMAAYSTIPVDLNHDGKLDLVAIGIRDFTGVDTLQFKTPIIQVYKNVSTPEHMRFENVTTESGLQFMNEPEALEKVTNGHYPVDLKGILEEGAAPESPDMVWEPNLSEGAAVDLANNGNPDLVMVDRQFKSTNPYTGEEFYPWVFENQGNFKFRWVPPSETGMKKTARAVSYGDLFGKGREDLAMVNGSGGGQTVEDSNNVWKNELANSNNWIEIKVRSATDGMGPLGLGAEVTVYKAGTSEVLGDEEESTDYSYRSKRDALLHFGLGQVSAVDVHVEGAGLGTPVTVHNVPINKLDTITLAPEAPTVAAGTSPSKSGVYMLSWAGPGGNNAGFTYTLQQKSASGSWSNVATNLTKSEYAFTSGSPEAEGTWTYRVTASYGGIESEPSSASQEIMVDKTAPSAPSVTASRAQDFAGGGGWYKNSVEVSFASNGDPTLTDGSPGSGVSPGSVPASQTFTTSGSHTACGTVKDNAGNESVPGCLTVQVDATPPSLEINCPATVEAGSSAQATFTASGEYSGLASAASGSVPIDTSSGGKKTVSTTAVSNVGLETTKSCTTDVEYSAPGAPTLTGGVNPSGSGLFTLSWTGTDPMTSFGLTYTLQEHNAASEEWKTVASGIEALSYEFAGAGEAEGTWVFRVQGTDGSTTEWSSASAPIVVDRTPPAAPTASAPAPYYSGDGGWYKESATVSYSANGDPNLADGSPGSGVNLGTMTQPETATTSGSHTLCGTVADNVGNVSEPGCVMVQVDATPPSLEVSCPAQVAIGASADATVTASDAYSGLKTDPSGTVPIDTSKAGTQTITRTAASNVGLETTKSCTTVVGYYIVINGPTAGNVVVRSGEAVELASAATVRGSVSVRPGGALDVEGARISNGLNAKGAALLRICGATISGGLTAKGGTGSLVIGESSSSCAASKISKGAAIKENKAGVSIDGNTFGSTLNVSGNVDGVTVVNNTVAGSLIATGNASGATVTGNEVTKNLTVTGNSGTVVDHPDEVKGKSKLQ